MRNASLGIITTVRHNIGDDFVREGILSLVSKVYDKAGRKGSFAVELIHKHSPVTTVYGFENLRSLRTSRIVEPVLRAARFKDRVASSDLLIQSGAPIYWCHPGISHCSDNEWYVPLIKKRFLRNRRGRKFLNIAGGSCQRYHSNGSELKDCTACQSYIREFFDVCDLTILRDELAKKMLNMVDRDAPVLPCTSIFSRDHLGVDPLPGEYIVLNFMDNGGHFKFGQAIDTEKWRRNFKELAQSAQKMGKVVMACHNQNEMNLAKEVVPDIDSFLVPDDHVEFMKFYARARFGVVNRVHAGFMMASLGKPVAVIGSDSRALMIKNLNLPAYFVEDVSDVNAILEDIAAQEHTYHEISSMIRHDARQRYIELLSDALFECQD